LTGIKFANVLLLLGAAVLFPYLLTPRPAKAQFRGIGDRVKKSMLCGGGLVGGLHLGDKVAQMEAKRLKLAGPAAAEMTRQFQIGVAMSFCGGGSAVQGTRFAQMSEKDKQERQHEIDAAVADEDPGTKTYALPDHPNMMETVSADPPVPEGNNECRTVKDHLAEGENGDSALVKYCHKPPDGKWALQTGL